MATSRPRPTRSLVIALVLSLGVHLALVPFLHGEPEARADPGPHILRIDRPAPIVVKPKPTPPPVRPTRTPRPEHLARATDLPRVVRKPRVVSVVAPPTTAVAANALARSPSLSTSRTAGAAATGDLGGAATTANDEAAQPTPMQTEAFATPTPSETPACAGAPREARVLDAISPDLPAIAAAQGATGHVEVRVDLTASGSVARASVRRSSGNDVLDRAAVDAAQRATYAPAFDGCGPIAGSYLYTVDYSE